MSSPGPFLIVGCGSIGKRHARNLRALGHDDLLGFDPRADRREEVEKELGMRAFADLDAAFDAKPRVVLVMSPTKLHVEVALRAAERGCHLFIEKPVSDAIDESLERLVALVAEKKLVTLVGCNTRFHPGLRTLKRLVDERHVGKVVAIRAAFGQYLPDWHPWEDYRQGYSARRDLGGGIVLDAIHEIDYMRWLMGEVASVRGFTAKLSHLEIDVEDTAAVIMRFASGALGELHLDYVQRTYTRTCSIIGDEGTLEWDFRTGGDVRVFRRTERGAKAAPGEWTTIPGPQAWDVNTMYIDEMKHFLACIAGEESTQNDVAEAKRVLEIALAAKKGDE